MHISKWGSGFMGFHLISTLSPWASPESRGIAPFIPLRPFSGVTPPIRVLPSDGETRTSFIRRHTFRESPSTSGVAVFMFSIKIYKIYGLSEIIVNGYINNINFAPKQIITSLNGLMHISKN